MIRLSLIFLLPKVCNNIRLVKEELTDPEKAHVAAEFGKWVRTNGLRELIETFSIFLHRLAFTCRYSSCGEDVGSIVKKY